MGNTSLSPANEQTICLFFTSFNISLSWDLSCNTQIHSLSLPPQKSCHHSVSSGHKKMATSEVTIPAHLFFFFNGVFANWSGYLKSSCLTDGGEGGRFIVFFSYTEHYSWMGPQSNTEHLPVMNQSVLNINQLLNISSIFAFVICLERVTEVLRGRRCVLWKFRHLKVSLLGTLTLSLFPQCAHQ